jgi:hypothetical protein
LKTCIRCAASDKPEELIVPATDHTYTAVETPSTCSFAGKIVYTCTCSHSYTVELPVLPHTWAETARVDSTCQTEGYVVYGCSGCVASYTEILAKTTHDLVDTIVPATCTTHGYTLHACANCEYSYQDNLVVAKGHAYTSEWAWAEDYATATLTFTCGNDGCGSVVVENAEITTKEIAGNCNTPNKTVYTATVKFNGSTYTDTKEVEGQANGHDYGDGYWKYNKHKHWHICKNCHGQQNVGSHEFDEGVVTVAPTCNKAGVKLFSCICGYTETEKIPATADKHTYADWTNDADGHWQACIHCGERTEKVAHTFGDWTVKVAPTCTVNGL